MRVRAQATARLIGRSITRHLSNSMLKKRLERRMVDEGNCIADASLISGEVLPGPSTCSDKLVAVSGCSAPAGEEAHAPEEIGRAASRLDACSRRSRCTRSSRCRSCSRSSHRRNFGRLPIGGIRAVRARAVQLDSLLKEAEAPVLSCFGFGEASGRHCANSCARAE